MIRHRPPNLHLDVLRLALLTFAALLAPATLRGEPRAPATLAGQVDSHRRSPEPARLSEQPHAESGRIDREAREVEQQLARRATRRDALLARLERKPAAGLPARLLDAWERRKTRAELAQLVVELQSGQARLLALRARRRGLAIAAAERDWERLQALVNDAARAWGEGRAEEPLLGPVIAEALDRAGGESPARTFERYRSLIDRLARVNVVLAESSPAAGSADVPGADGPRIAPETGASEFLGVAERGLPVSRSAADASQEAWKRLRTTLADEIVSTATEITLRVRESS